MFPSAEDGRTAGRKRLATPMLWRLRQRREPHAAGPRAGKTGTSGASPLAAVTTADVTSAAYSVPGPVLSTSHESFPSSKQLQEGAWGPLISSFYR